MLKLFEFNHFAPISVLLDALHAIISSTAATFGGGGYSDIILPDNRLAKFAQTCESFIKYL